MPRWHDKKGIIQGYVALIANIYEGVFKCHLKIALRKMVKRLYNIDAIYLYYELDGCISGGFQHTNCDIFLLVSALIIDHEYCFDQNEYPLSRFKSRNTKKVIYNPTHHAFVLVYMYTIRGISEKCAF